jgi:hypothetical protein
VVCVLAGCGQGTAQTTPATTTAATSAPTGPSAAELRAQREQEERAEREAIVASHRKLEHEAQDALAMTCEEPEPRTEHQRCLPSCYATEPADPRAGKKQAGTVAIEHVVCRGKEDGAFAILDELDASKLQLRPHRGKFPRAHAKGWRKAVHPLTRARLQCVTVSQVTRALRRPLDGCGATGTTTACEAIGDAAARGINVVHFRLAEAKRLRAANKAAACQQAALEAIAVARGLPRWRQYAKLNVGKWREGQAYRTRFDGTLDEDTLFATAAAMGVEAESVWSACGGAGTARTTSEQEQSFHACW